MSIEAMKQALEALELVGMEGWMERSTDAIITLRQAIEQAEKSQSMWIWQNILKTFRN